MCRVSGISESALKNLEAGRGASLSTFIQVCRTLGKDEWIMRLGPTDAVNDFLRSGIEIAPFEFPLQRGRNEFSFLDRPASAFYGLPSVFADSLPDSFGNSVIDAWMERQNVMKSSMTATSFFWLSREVLGLS